MLGAALALVVVAIALFGVAAWFGMVFLAPRIGRAMDRAEEREESGDRTD